MSRYIIRYRPCGEALEGALIVEDERRVAYLFSGGRLQGWLAGPDASERLVRALGRRGRWLPVPPVAGYTLEGLCRLTGALDRGTVGAGSLGSPGSASRETASTATGPGHASGPGIGVWSRPGSPGDTP